MALSFPRCAWHHDIRPTSQLHVWQYTEPCLQHTELVLNVLQPVCLTRPLVNLIEVHLVQHFCDESIDSSPSPSSSIVPGRVLYQPSPSSPVLVVSLLQTSLVHVMSDVLHPPHSWSSFCLRTSHSHLHRLIHLIVFLPTQNVSTPAQSGLPRLQVMSSSPKSLLTFRLLFLLISVTPLIPFVVSIVS